MPRGPAELSLRGILAATVVLSDAAPRKFEAARLYGGIGSYAYYFTDLLVGQPQPQRTSVIVDTGSRLVAFPCRGCAHCGRHLDPAFDVSRSRSARWVNCTSDCGDECSRGHCSYSETYSEGSSITGFWFNDMVELGDPLNKNPPVSARLGCHQDENNLFYTQRANGIMGLAPSEWGGQPTVLQNLFGDKRHVSTEIFSLCLAENGGQLTVGGFDESYHVKKDGDTVGSSTVQWTRLSASKYYYIFPEELLLGGKRVPFSADDFGDTIVDSGTTFTYLPKQVFRALIDSLDSYCQQHDGCGAESTSDECWRLNDSAEGPSKFPTLTFVFEGNTRVDWPASRYLQPRGEWGTWCRTVLENDDFQTVLGLSFMVHKDVIFDIKNLKLGLAEAHCPEYMQQPAPLQQAWARVGTARPVLKQDRSRRWLRKRLVCYSSLAALSTVALLWVAWRAKRTARSRAPDLEEDFDLLSKD